MKILLPAQRIKKLLLLLIFFSSSVALLHAEEASIDAVTQEITDTNTEQIPAATEANTAQETVASPTATLGDYRSISERPLFHSSRRPRPDANGNKNPGDLSQKWRLSGIILQQGSPIALFSSKEQGGTARRIEAGMPLERRWLLDEVGPDYALVSDGDEQVRFELWQPRAVSIPNAEPTKQPEDSKASRTKLKPLIVEKAVNQKTD